MLVYLTFSVLHFFLMPQSRIVCRGIMFFITADVTYAFRGDLGGVCVCVFVVVLACEGAEEASGVIIEEAQSFLYLSF